MMILRKLMYSVVRFSPVLALAACTSAPIHYHALIATDGDEAGITPAFLSSPFLLEILPVGIPAEVDRQELVIRQRGGIAYLEGERWAAPLNDEVRETLGVLLQRRLGVQDSTGLIRPAGVPVLRVKLMLRQFESVPGGYAQVDADWNLTQAGGGDRLALICHGHYRVPAQSDYLSLVQAHQQIMVVMAGQIAETARGWMENANRRCP